MVQDWRLLGKTWERLRWARLRAGYDKAKDAAESLNIKPGTYRTYEYDPKTNNGREPSLSELQRICRKLKVSWTWVATGEGSPDFDPIRNQHMNDLAAIEQDVPEEDREKAWNAALGAFQSFKRLAG